MAPAAVPFRRSIYQRPLASASVLRKNQGDMSNASAIDDATMLARPANLVASEIDGEMVILNIESGHFFQLNQIGSRIWEALEVPSTMGELCRAMHDRFEVDEQTCRRDVVEFVGLLSQNGLVTVKSATAG
jgi:hypothetical protein